MKNGPIFEWTPGNIIFYEQEDEEDYGNLIKDLQHQHNYGEKRYYVPDDYDEHDNRPGSWEAEYVAMDEEEGMIVTDDDISEGGRI